LADPPIADGLAPGLRILDLAAGPVNLGGNMGNAISADVLNDLAPTGALRAAINFGNPVLAQKDPRSGEPRGISADLATELGRRLGVPVAFVPHDTAGKVADGVNAGVWDICFLANEPARATDIAFTAPYVIIEGTYLVRSDSRLKSVDDADRDGVRIAVGNKAAYDLYLSRTLKRAELVRAPSSEAAMQLFLDENLDAAAGVRQPLETFAAAHPGLRVMDGRFMAIEQAMGTPKARAAGARYLRAFVEEMKAAGFVAAGLARSGQGDAMVAPRSPAQI
jgi:polar amino acid transport system substrate-binding protein